MDITDPQGPQRCFDVFWFRHQCLSSTKAPSAQWQRATSDGTARRPGVNWRPQAEIPAFLAVPELP